MISFYVWSSYLQLLVMQFCRKHMSRLSELWNILTLRFHGTEFMNEFFKLGSANWAEIQYSLSVFCRPIVKAGESNDKRWENCGDLSTPRKSLTTLIGDLHHANDCEKRILTIYTQTFVSSLHSVTLKSRESCSFQRSALNLFMDGITTHKSLVHWSAKQGKESESAIKPVCIVNDPDLIICQLKLNCCYYVTSKAFINGGQCYQTRVTGEKTMSHDKWNKICSNFGVHLEMSNFCFPGYAMYCRVFPMIISIPNWVRHCMTSFFCHVVIIFHLFTPSRQWSQT